MKNKEQLKLDKRKIQINFGRIKIYRIKIPIYLSLKDTPHTLFTKRSSNGTKRTTPSTYVTRTLYRIHQQALIRNSLISVCISSQKRILKTSIWKV